MNSLYGLKTFTMTENKRLFSGKKRGIKVGSFIGDEWFLSLVCYATDFRYHGTYVDIKGIMLQPSYKGRWYR